MNDGKFSSVDNRRLYAAYKAGIKVRARIHKASDPLSFKHAKRFNEANKAIVKTWGEAVEYRVLDQDSLIMRQCYDKGIPVSKLVINSKKEIRGLLNLNHHNYDYPINDPPAMRRNLRALDTPSKTQAQAASTVLPSIRPNATIPPHKQEIIPLILLQNSSVFFKPAEKSSPRKRKKLLSGGSYATELENCMAQPKRYSEHPANLSNPSIQLANSFKKN